VNVVEGVLDDLSLAVFPMSLKNWAVKQGGNTAEKGAW